jgi:transposase
MNEVKVQRLDHLAVVAGVIKDLGIIEMIDARIPVDEQEKVTTGEAIAAMIVNGLGFTSQPLYMTPRFFENKPVEEFFRKGVSAEHFNRFKLSRALDDAFNFGCDILFSDIAFHVCAKEKINTQFNSLDTTSFSVTGQYLPDTDEEAILITPGYSKDHRPDLKQACLELMVSQDGGVPFLSKVWDGNETDTEIFKTRTKDLIEQFETSEAPRYLVADCKLYTEANAQNLAKHRFITRIPGALKAERQVIEQSWRFNQWKPLVGGYRYQSIRLCHYGVEQRWLIIFSQAAWDRAQATLEKACKKEKQKIGKQLFHLQAQRFESVPEAHSSLDKITEKMKYHTLDHHRLIEHLQYARKGRPTVDTPVKAVYWQIEAGIAVDPQKITQEQKKKACFVLSTNEMNEKQLSDEQILSGYKGQSSVEGGFRFLKDPLFFTSSFFVKKPSRLQALLMVMTLALLVYSVAQRRLRKQLEREKETLPDQLGKPTATPSLRWIFQLLDGIHQVTFRMQDQMHILIEGLTELKRKILRFFGKNVCQLYRISCS